MSAGLVMGEFNNGTVTSASISVRVKVAPLALGLKADNSLPPHMTLVTLEFLPQHWNSEFMNLSENKPLHSFFKRNASLSKRNYSDSSSPSRLGPLNLHRTDLWYVTGSCEM